jgi:hypothetical protein
MFQNGRADASHSNKQSIQQTKKNRGSIVSRTARTKNIAVFQAHCQKHKINSKGYAFISSKNLKK